jgi:hypothetical protein
VDRLASNKTARSGRRTTGKRIHQCGRRSRCSVWLSDYGTKTYIYFPLADTSDMRTEDDQERSGHYEESNPFTCCQDHRVIPRRGTLPECPHLRHDISRERYRIERHSLRWAQRLFTRFHRDVHGEHLEVVFYLASALAYMHSQNVQHEDLKPTNIFCSDEHIFSPTLVFIEHWEPAKKC